MVVLAVALAMVACKGDEGAAKDVAGVYTGKTSYAIAGNPYGESAMTLTVTERTESTVDVSIPSQTYTIQMGGREQSVALPELAVSDIKVTGKDGKYTIAEKEFEVEAEGMKFKGNLKGTVENNTMVMSYNVTPTGMPMAIEFVFTGTK